MSYPTLVYSGNIKLRQIIPPKKERKTDRKNERKTSFQARMLSREKSLLASSCPPVRMYQCGSCWTDLCEIWY